MEFLVFYCTFPDKETASRISKDIVERNLAACANIFSMESAYWWDGAVQQEGEYVALLKTRIEYEALLEKALEAVHPYDVPCLMRYEVRANQAYVDWIYESTIGVL